MKNADKNYNENTTNLHQPVFCQTTCAWLGQKFTTDIQ